MGNNLKHRYYHERIIKTFKFLIEPKKRILFFGCQEGYELISLSPETAVGVEQSSFVPKNKHHFPNISFAYSLYEKYLPKNKFDYIVLYGTLGKTQNIPKLLNHLKIACKPTTRIIIYQHNYLWQGLLKISERLNLKIKEYIYNWLSLPDVTTYLYSAGIETTRVWRRTLCPIKLWCIGPFVNYIAAIIPVFDFLKLDQFIIARPFSEMPTKNKQPSLSICITVRDEKENIEPIVASLPKLAANQEIIFIEGHSIDSTREEIRKVITKYPQKNIRLIIQPGIGQGDATRTGFMSARGDIIFIYEGDGTADPNDLIYFYRTMSSGRFEFILGSRLVYPVTQQVMPNINKFGNMIFARLFSFILGQNTTDVLCGIKAISKKNFDIMVSRWGFLGINDPFGDFELLFGAARMGLKIGEIPVHYHPRFYGTTKTRVFTHGFYLLKMTLSGYWIFRTN